MVVQDVCKRCRQGQVSVLSRKEPFCNDCFSKFVSAKQRKQMMCEPYCQDVFKVLYQDKVRSEAESVEQNAHSKVLVPLSFGSSSVVLLDILNDTLTEQKETQRGKTGFHIDVLVCGRDQDDIVRYREMADRLLSERYASNREKIKFHFLSVESFYKDCGGELDTILVDSADFSSRSIVENGELNREFGVEDLLKQCPDRSSRQDLLTILSSRLIKKFAYQNKHKIILWGHSMTKLADETISLVVKGRGSQIASMLSIDECDPLFDNSFKNLYPLQDVLLSEIDAYCYIKHLDPFMIDYIPQDTLLVEKQRNPELVSAPRSVKNLTLNEIARKYFDDVEADYSNVISTVVRTALKLGEPETPKPERCSICRANVHMDPSEYLQTITVSENHPIETTEESALYDKWNESQFSNQKIENTTLRDSIPQKAVSTSLCYGCLINVNRMKGRKLTWPQHSKSELETILDAFEL
ncbi:hypothetical protein HG536_0D03160 [Torulaspora globosa]|uniref:Cytoplasmic tRNA 2-thiolation protein 2 n=1 Tax=Torulaspora globosa TaxID=48254 RepID=A0A7G3ZH08_9SACH|nr:uncharacterized protein HG536_0D03160 [Torulaspora globosa]QLL32794.1 hypothetical protein HG536_0D03160 [Torulaspora globosa]